LVAESARLCKIRVTRFSRLCRIGTKADHVSFEGRLYFDRALSAVGGPDCAIVVNEIEFCADGAFRKPTAPEILRNTGG